MANLIRMICKINDDLARRAHFELAREEIGYARPWLSRHGSSYRLYIHLPNRKVYEVRRPYLAKRLGDVTLYQDGMIQYNWTLCGRGHMDRWTVWRMLDDGRMVLCADQTDPCT